MMNAWRYHNGGGTGYTATSYVTFEVTGLAANMPYYLYFYGGTTTSGQFAGLSLASGNALGANPQSASTANGTANSNGAYGSLFTSNGSGGHNLLAEGTTWNVLYGQSDGSGDFTFSLDALGNGAYMNGFQLMPAPAPEPSILALAGAGFGLLSLACLRRRH